MISKVEIAGPGFINFFLDDNARFAILDTIMEQKATLVHPKNLPVKIKLSLSLPTQPQACTWVTVAALRLA